MTAQDPYLKLAIETNFTSCPYPECGAPLFFDHNQNKIFCDSCGKFEYNKPTQIRTHNDEKDVEPCTESADMVMWAKID